MKQTILLVGDEGYEVMTAFNAVQANLRMKEKIFDLIVLDVMMLGTDGFSFCKQMRDTVSDPILF
ncbi:response regulator [Brevibacterium sp. JNUCC-42]|nr:response regulator [Brevibacterium sp. JNUCC-42]